MKNNESVELTKCFFKHLDSVSAEGVIFSVVSDSLISNSIRFLPEKYKRILIVLTESYGSYKIFKELYPYSNFNFFMSSRIQEALNYRVGMNKSNQDILTLPVIHNLKVLTRPIKKDNLKLIYYGRVRNSDKGVYILPQILKHLDKSKYQLTIVGDGPDLNALKKKLRPYSDNVEFYGEVPREVGFNILSNHDLVLMPSYTESYGFSLVEAMSLGCIPIATDIAGSFDRFVIDGHNGYLFKIGSAKVAAKKIQLFFDNPKKVSVFSRRSLDHINKYFSLKNVVNKINSALSEIEKNKCKIESLDLNNWSMHECFNPGIRSYIPNFIKRGFYRIFYK